MFPQKQLFSLMPVFIFLSSLAKSQELPPVCRDDSATVVSLQEQRTYLDETVQYLQAVTDGRVPKNLAISRYFTIDLKDETAVQKRLAEIKRAAGQQEDVFLALQKTKFHQETCADAINPMLKELFKLRQQTFLLKISFFEIPKEKRDAILKSHIKASDFAGVTKKLGQEKQDLEQTIVDSEKLRLAAEIDAVRAATPELRTLAGERAQLESVRKSLAEFHSSWLDRIEERFALHSVDAQALAALSAALGSREGQSQEELIRSVQEVMTIWRSLVDDSLAVFFLYLNPPPVPELPSLPKELIAKIEGEEAADYRIAWEQANREREDFLREQKERLESNLRNYHELLEDASLLRAHYMDAVRKSKVSLLGFITWEDVVREIKAVPYKVFGILFSRFFSFRNDLNRGFPGIVALGKDLLVLIFIFLVPFAFTSLSKRVRGFFENYMKRRRSVALARQHSGWFSLPYIISVSMPLISWVLALVTVLFLSSLLRDTAFEEVASLLPIVMYYIIYRIFRLSIRPAFFALRGYGNLSEIPHASVLINQTSNLIGRFFLFAAVFLYLVELAVGQAIIYILAFKLMILVGTFMVALASAKWNIVIAPAAENLLPGKLGSYGSRFCQGRLKILFCLPVLCSIVLFLSARWLYYSLKSTNLSKRLLAQLFKRQIERDLISRPQVQRSPPPKEYLACFAEDHRIDEEEWVGYGSGVRESIFQELDLWKNDETEEHSLAIVGEKGLGKTNLGYEIAKKYADISVQHLTVPRGLYQPKSVLKFFSEQLEYDLTGGANAIEGLNDNTNKKIIVVDNAHNMFLAMLGGFEGYKTFVDMVNANTPNIYWIAICNQHAWNYLNGVFGKNHFFRNVFYLPKWSDEEIYELIIRRHASTGFQLSYRDLIFATQGIYSSESSSIAEKQFIRLIWEQSRGIPRVALKLWASALSSSANNILSVTLPFEPEITDFAKLSDQSHFVFAEIVRHENLSKSEISIAANISVGVVANTLKIGLENQMLEKADHSRYRLTGLWQNAIINFLRSRNFVYGRV